MSDERTPISEHARALPLATTDARRCKYKRENGHRCALPFAHASEHFYREDGVPWRGTRPETGLTETP